MIEESAKKQFEEVIDFFKVNNIIHWPDESNKENYSISFILDLNSYVKENNETIKIQDKFKFVLTIPRDYPRNSISLRAYEPREPLFHPHFRIPGNLITEIASKFFPVIKEQYTEWIDYENNISEGVVSLIKRVIFSLQYYPEYINNDAKSIGNIDALNWYARKFLSGKQSFPTGTYLSELLQKQAEAEGNNNQTGRHVSTREILIRKQDNTSKKKFEISNNDGQQTETGKKKKFIIDNDIPGYEPEEQELNLRGNEMHQAFYERIESNSNTYNNRCLIYINAEARKELYSHIEWGNLISNANKVEQGGLLLGNVYKDSSRGIQYALVERIVKAVSAKGDAASLNMNHQTWYEMVQKIDGILDEHKDYKLQIIGWYHTHPNRLNVFMSAVDMETQRRFFYLDWQYAIVLNPHRKIWKAFYGKNAVECLGIISDEEVAENSPVNDTKRRFRGIPLGYFIDGHASIALFFLLFSYL